jgi:prepilin-type processing-associated H-X9-DG protein
MVLALASTAGAQAPRPLAKYVPAEGLVAYGQFDGLDAHAAAWAKTAARGVLVETTTGAMLESLVRQVADVITSNVGSRSVDGRELVAIVKHVIGKGGAVGINGELGDGPPNVTVVFRGAAKAPIRDPFERLIRSAIAEGAQTQVLTRQDGRKLVVVRTGEDQPGWTFWAEGEDFVIVAGRDEFAADAVIASLDGKRPGAGGNPLVAELAKPEGGFEPIGFGFIEGSALPPLPPQLGLGGLKRVDYRTGFQGEALVTLTRVVAPAPRKGILALFDQPAIDPKTLPPLPASLKGYTVASLDLAKSYDTVVELVKGLDPNAAQAVDGVNQSFQQMTGVKLRDELLAQLGPRMAFYVQPKLVPASLTPFGAAADWLLHLPPVVALVEVKDPGAFGTTLDSLMTAANRVLAGMASSEGGPVKFEPLKAPARGYRLVVPAQVFPLPTTIRPGIVLGERYLAISTTLDGAREALAVEKPLALPQGLPKGLVFLNVQDPRDSMPELIANLPFMVQMLGRMGPGGPFGPPRPEQNPLAAVVMDPELVPSAEAIRKLLFPSTITVSADAQGLTIATRDAIPSVNPISSAPIAAALLLPAVQSARTAARRAQSVNNMKQIGLAMHNFHSSFNTFPAAAICDQDGKPLLSWRVAILPYIEQQALYNEFHLDEPWDSEHNKTLIDKMPRIYAIPNAPAPDGQTYYQVFVDNGALFDVSEGIGLEKVTDGTSNTILCVEAGKSVPWTKPEDITYDPEKPLPKLGNHFPGGFNAGFADGSVKFIKHTIDMDTLRALITRDGGEVVSADSF